MLVVYSFFPGLGFACGGFWKKPRNLKYFPIYFIFSPLQWYFIHSILRWHYMMICFCHLRLREVCQHAILLLQSNQIDWWVFTPPPQVIAITGGSGLPPEQCWYRGGGGKGDFHVVYRGFRDLAVLETSAQSSLILFDTAQSLNANKICMF